jgi:beta-glucosidase/6-phospho-beta-glucosidase/beta-galactosidase
MVFPKNFIWGTSAATHQFEENNTNNNWYEWKKSLNQECNYTEEYMSKCI